jgi:hypothetical protein
MLFKIKKIYIKQIYAPSGSVETSASYSGTAKSIIKLGFQCYAAIFIILICGINPGLTWLTHILQYEIRIKNKLLKEELNKKDRS